MENGQTAQIEGEYALDNSHAGLKISTRQLTIAEVQSRAEQVISAPPIPLLEKLRQGTWKGWIAFDRSGDHPGVWSGEYDLQNAAMEIPGVAAPLRFTSASVEMKNGGIHIDRIRAHVGAVKLEGDYRYDPDAGRPHRVRLRVAEVQLAEMERLMLPTLRRNEGFLARTFRLRKEVAPQMASGARSGRRHSGGQPAERRFAHGRVSRAPGVGRALHSVVQCRLPPG